MRVIARSEVVSAAVGLLLLAVAGAALAAEGSPATRTVERFVAAFNEHDAKRMVALCATDVRWMSVAGDQIGTDAEGVEALEAAMGQYFAGLPSARAVLHGMTESGDFVTTVEEARWESRGEQRSQCSLAVYELREGRIQNVWYFPSHDCKT